jgi:DNA-binding protein H-NS
MNGIIKATAAVTCDLQKRGKTMQLRSMSIEKLTTLRNQVEAALTTKVAHERRTLQAELGRLSRFGSGRVPSYGFRGGTVAPKYRNPNNSTETWAGRGLKPRWLAAAIKAGGKLEDFAIAGPAKAAAVKKTPRKTRKARKTAKK